MRALVYGTLVMGFVSTPATHAQQVETGGALLATGATTLTRLELGGTVPVECADGCSSVVVHSVALVARRSVAHTQGEEERVRELEVRYEQFNGCDFSSTVVWGTLRGESFRWWQP
jgi:hypothetical protein